MKVTMQKVDPVRLLWRRLLMLGLLILVLIGVSGVWKVYRGERESSALNASSQARLADLTQRASELESDIANLDTDRGKEAALREQYGMGRGGEQVIVIVDPKPATPTEATSTSVMQRIRGWLQWW